MWTGCTRRSSGTSTASPRWLPCAARPSAKRVSPWGSGREKRIRSHVLWLRREDPEHGLRDPVDVGVGQFLVDGEFEAMTAPARDLVGKLGRAGGMRRVPQVHALHAQLFQVFLKADFV